MTTIYEYQKGYFGTKDDLPENNPLKLITGIDFEDQFSVIAPAIESRILDVDGQYTGTLTGGSLSLFGPLTASYINGGKF
jgi:hypothetical protein